MSTTLLKEPTRQRPGSDHGDRSPASMQWVYGIIRPERLDAVRDALAQAGVGGVTVTEVRGFGRQKGQVEHYRGGTYTIRFIPKVRIELAVQASQVDDVLKAIAASAKTGQVGDGKVFVMDLQHVHRIRTGEQGTVAL